MKRRVERGLLLGLGVLVVAGAAPVGGVFPAHQLWLSAAALALLTLTIGWRALKRGALGAGGPFWVLAALAGVCLLQLLSLSAAWIQALQPVGASLTAYSTDGLGGVAHRALSLDPPATALEVCKLLGYASLAASAALLVRDKARALLLLWTINLAGLVLGALAALHLAGGIGQAYWLYQPAQGRQFVLPFVNPNHAGAFYGALFFLNLVLGLQLRDSRRRSVVLALGTLPLGLLVSSGSRGALVAAVVAGLLLCALLWRHGHFRPGQLGYALAITAIVATVTVPASETLRSEFGDKTQWGALDQEGKVRLWKSSLSLARDYPLTGVGRGAFRAAFPRYNRVNQSATATFSYAENLFIQLLVELGPLVFGILLLGGLLLVGRYLWGRDLELVELAALVPIALLLGQNLADFNLEFPGTGFLFVALCGLLAGLARGRTRVVGRRALRVCALAAWGLFIVASAFALIRLGSWGLRRELRAEGEQIRQRLLRARDSGADLRAARQAIRRHPADYYLHYLAGVAASRVPGERPLAHFNRALYLNPISGPVHHQVGRTLLKLGRQRQALTYYLGALRRGLPLEGALAAELDGLLQALWGAGDAANFALGAGACLAPQALVGAPTSPACSLLLFDLRQRRVAALGALLTADPKVVRKLARRLVRTSNPELGLAVAEWLLERWPDDSRLLELLASNWKQSGDLTMALHWSRRALKKRPRPAGYLRLARLHERAGQQAQALVAADAGLERHPRALRLILFKARILVAKGALAGARATLSAAPGPSELGLRGRIDLLAGQLALERASGHPRRAARLKARLQLMHHQLPSGKRPRR